ncbi:hypothetical protein ACFE04_008965 [Oxalis oulophora]
MIGVAGRGWAVEESGWAEDKTTSCVFVEGAVDDGLTVTGGQRTTTAHSWEAVGTILARLIPTMHNSLHFAFSEYHLSNINALTPSSCYNNSYNERTPGLINMVVVAPTIAAVGLASFSYGFPQAVVVACTTSGSDGGDMAVGIHAAPKKRKLRERRVPSTSFSRAVGKENFMEYLATLRMQLMSFLQYQAPIIGRRPLRTPSFIRAMFADETVVVARPANVRFAPPPADAIHQD